MEDRELTTFVLTSNHHLVGIVKILERDYFTGCEIEIKKTLFTGVKLLVINNNCAPIASLRHLNCTIIDHSFAQLIMCKGIPVKELQISGDFAKIVNLEAEYHYDTLIQHYWRQSR